MRVLCGCVLCVCREDDSSWPEPDHVGRQELEVVLGNDHISFTVRWVAVLHPMGRCVCAPGIVQC